MLRNHVGIVLLSCSFADGASVTSQNEKTTLLGKTKQDYASILRWMSFTNSDFLSALSGWFCPLIGREQYNKKNVEENMKTTQKAVDAFEKHLLMHTYLVGERVTLADVFAVGCFTRGFQFVSWPGRSDVA